MDAALVLGLVVASIGLGVYSDKGQVVSGALGWLSGLATPWLLLAWLSGRLFGGRGWRVSLIAGAAPVGIALSTYFMFVKIAHGTSFYNQFNDGRGARWYLLAVLIGPVAGLLGAASTRPPGWLRSVGWGAIIAIPLSEIRYVRTWGAGSSERPIELLLVAVAGGLLLLSGLRNLRSTPSVCGAALLGTLAGWELASIALQMNVV